MGSHGSDAAWRTLVGKVRSGGYDSLTAEERSWYCVRELLDAVAAGGIRGYFAGDGADRYADCLEGLRVVGGGALPTLLSLVAKYFPFGVPTDRQARRKLMDAWPRDGSVEQILDPVEEQAQLEARFVERRLSEFVEIHLSTGA